MLVRKEMTEHFSLLAMQLTSKAKPKKREISSDQKSVIDVSEKKGNSGMSTD